MPESHQSQLKEGLPKSLMGGLPIIPEEIPIHPEQVTYTEMTSESLEQKEIDVTAEPEKTPQNESSQAPEHIPDGGEPSITISAKQASRMFAIAKSCGWSINELRTYLAEKGITESKTTPLNLYDGIIKHIQDNDKVKVS